jgi:hypothetical protein
MIEDIKELKYVLITDVEKIIEDVCQLNGFDYSFFGDIITKIKAPRNIVKNPDRRKYACDDDFFSRDDEKSFYWAGFWAADGCIFKNRNSKQIILSLSEKDVVHLELFKSQVQFNGITGTSISRHSLTNPKWHDSTKKSLYITSAKLFEDLSRFNVVPAKTHTYTFPEWLLDHELVNHFIRGYFDGDGCITFHKELPPKSSKAEINMRGTLDFLWAVKNLFQDRLTLNSKTTPKLSNGIGILKYSGNRLCTEIRDFLYKDATIYLGRKYDLCQSIMAKRQKYATRKSITEGGLFVKETLIRRV